MGTGGHDHFITDAIQLSHPGLGEVTVLQNKPVSGLEATVYGLGGYWTLALAQGYSAKALGRDAQIISELYEASHRIGTLSMGGQGNYCGLKFCDDCCKKDRYREKG